MLLALLYSGPLVPSNSSNAYGVFPYILKGSLHHHADRYFRTPWQHIPPTRRPRPHLSGFGADFSQRPPTAAGSRRDILIETPAKYDTALTVAIASISDQDWYISRTHGVYHIP
jgi:hypothetical protein